MDGITWCTVCRKADDFVIICYCINFSKGVWQEMLSVGHVKSTVCHQRFSLFEVNVSPCVSGLQQHVQSQYVLPFVEFYISYRFIGTIRVWFLFEDSPCVCVPAWYTSLLQTFDLGVEFIDGPPQTFWLADIPNLLQKNYLIDRLEKQWLNRNTHLQ